MLIVRSTYSCAPACGGDKARETGRSASAADEGGWYLPDNEVASPNASEPVSASCYTIGIRPTCRKRLYSASPQKKRAEHAI